MLKKYIVNAALVGGFLASISVVAAIIYGAISFMIWMLGDVTSVVTLIVSITVSTLIAAGLMTAADYYIDRHFNRK